MPIELSRDAFKELSETAAVPSYDPGKLTAGIVHFGVGFFLRVLLAVYLDDLFNLGLEHDRGLIGAGGGRPARPRPRAPARPPAARRQPRHYQHAC